MTSEVWVVTWYAAQDNVWHMQGVLGRDKCRNRVGTLAAMWPSINFVSAKKVG